MVTEGWAGEFRMDLNLGLYIRSDAFILVPALYFIGVFLRQTPFIQPWSYAWIQMFFAVTACLLYYGFEIQAVVQGILVTGVAVMFREIIESMLMKYRDSLKKADDPSEDP
jgi:hypothetical protein